MYDCRSDERKRCSFHPREVVVGICALCLNERLLILADSKQAFLHQPHKSFRPTKKPPILLTKIFALTSLLNRLDVKHHKPVHQFHTSSTSPEDSFISIKFEDNGVASWEKGSKMRYDEQCGMSWNYKNWDKDKKVKSLVEHAKPLRWRKRIGHIFQLIRWKRANRGTMCHVGTRRSKGL